MSLRLGKYSTKLSVMIIFSCRSKCYSSHQVKISFSLANTEEKKKNECITRLKLIISGLNLIKVLNLNHFD